VAVLVVAENPEEIIGRMAPDPALAHIARGIWKPAWVDRVRENPRLKRKLHEPAVPADRRVFTSEGARKRFVIVQVGADLTVLSHTNAGYLAAMRDLYALDVEPGVAFPDAGMRAYWEKWNKGRPYLSLHAPFAAWKRALEAGFRPWWQRRMDEAKKRRKLRMGEARTWYVTGKPRCVKLLRREKPVLARRAKCRVVEGSDELLPLIMRGVDYGEHAKDYLSDCLLLQPSFVCEVGGEPVCWAGTHLSGTMGMIYTPPEHRRKGYGQALAALQIDCMLARDGIAVAHVVIGNRASEGLLKGFGAQHSAGTITWRSLRWPRWKYRKLRR